MTRPLSTLLACQSFFSEGRSTVSPARLVRVAAERGFGTVGLVDWCSVAGAVELCSAAREAGVRAVIGTTLPVLFPAPPRSPQAQEAYPLVLLAKDREGYAALCDLLTHLHLESSQGVPLAVLGAAARPGHLVALTGGRSGFPSLLAERREVARAADLLRILRGVFGEDLYLQLAHGAAPGERRRLEYLRGLARDVGVPGVTAPEVHMAEPGDYALLDALVCARLGIDVQTPHIERPRNDARHVWTPGGWGEALLYPDALLNAERLGQACALDLLPERLEPPEPRLRPGQTAHEALEERVFVALTEKYPAAELPAADIRLRQELATVRSLDMAGFFLTAAEVTDYCQVHGILAAGRGSAAGSVLCYLLGITASDPIRHGLLFERFLHTGRRVMPDVDIDIASSRRDQVLSWVEERWGHGGVGQGMVANRITYRLPSAVQDLGRALGLPPESRDRLSRALGRDFRHHRPHRAREAAVVFDEVLGPAPVKEALLNLLERIEPGFVRHLAPHSGGVVMSARPLTMHSPLTRSSGGLRTLSFNKEDVEKLGLVKLDLLGLRMLSVLERTREEVLRLSREWIDLGNLPDDPAVWARIGSGDTLGLFQIESPAQTQMTARLQPKNMTQLAHQIALVRPGPIQSATVHPYVRRARGEEPVPDLSEPLRSILGVTHGTLMFQEQILRIGVYYAGFSWPDADRFRSRLGKAEDEAELNVLREAFVQGAARTTGALPAAAGEVFNLCAAYRGYGFAESHATAFALHSYASAYLRHHHPAAFLAGVLAESPGMWPASTISHEARRWGVGLRPVCVNRSGVSYRAETARVVRVPLSAVKGVSVDLARHIVQERLVNGKYRGVEDLYDRVNASADVLEHLAQSGALDSLDERGNRRRALYLLQSLAHARPPGTRALLGPAGDVPGLPDLSADEALHLDLQTTGLSASGRHPLDAHRARLRDVGCVPLGAVRHGQAVWAAGVVVARQRPPTAAGFAFYVLEDSTGRAQAIISPDLWEAHRVLLRDAGALLVQGTAEVRGRAVTVKVGRLAELPLGQVRQAAD